VRRGNKRAADFWRDCALGIIRKHKSMAARQQAQRLLDEAHVDFGLNRAQILDIEAQHLLAAAQNTRLGHGGAILLTERTRGGRRLCAGMRQAGVSLSSLPVTPTTTRLGPEAGHVHGDVRCAARLFVLTEATHNRHRRLRGDAPDIAPRRTYQASRRPRQGHAWLPTSFSMACMTRCN
jgi:hypothetical protein